MASDTITLYGAGFTPSSRVKLNSQDVQTLYVNPNVLKAIVPTGTPIGTYPVTIYNPPMGGGTSGARVLTIIAQANSNLAVDYAYTTRQTIYQEIDSARAIFPLPSIDEKLLPTSILPSVKQIQMSGSIFLDGTIRIVLLDESSVSPSLGDAPTVPIRSVKQTILNSSDSSIAMYDAQGELLNRGKLPIPLFTRLIDSLRAGAALQMGGGGIPSASSSMTAVLTKARAQGASDSALGNGRFKVVMTGIVNGYTVPLPNGTRSEMILDTTNNIMESIQIARNGIPFSSTYFKYGLGPNGILQPQIIRNESFYKLAGGTAMKTVHILEYQNVRYTNYIRP